MAPGRIARPAKHSPTGLERLIACPFGWALRYAGELYGAGGVRLPNGTSVRLLGDLLHAVLNRVFAGPAVSPDEAARAAEEIFDRDGPRLVAALFLPGADTLRARVRRTAAATARSLFALMRAQGVRVTATEKTVDRPGLGGVLEGCVDLVLGDPPRVLDLKWGGANGKREALAAGTAIQLAAYAYLVQLAGAAFPPVGYFVMDGQRLLTTDPDRFHDAELVEGPAPAETWRAVEASHAVEWRAIEEGRLEARGIAPDGDEEAPDQAQVADGRILLPPACEWCDFVCLCGQAFVEAE